MRRESSAEGAEGADFLAHETKGFCQCNDNRSPNGAKRGLLDGQLAPLGEGSGAVVLEDGSLVQMTVEVEVIVDRGVNGGEFLQGPDVPEFGYSTLSSSERLM